jgi:hypothetical protein
MGKHKISEYRNHERISAALQKKVDPVLKSAASRKLHAEDFVFGKNQEKTTNSNSQSAERPGAGRW